MLLVSIPNLLHTQEVKLGQDSSFQPAPPVNHDLDEAINRIRVWYQLGSRSLALRSANSRPAVGLVADEAKTLRTSEAYLRKLRQFADPKSGYTPEQLEQLCKLCRASGRTVGISAILLLVTVHDRRLRGKLQRRFLQEGWGCIRLSQEMRAELGRRRHGGRRPRLASDLAGILAQTDGLVERWVRWERAVSNPSVSWQLPREVLKGITKVAEAAQELRKTVELSQAMPHRRPLPGRPRPGEYSAKARAALAGRA